MLMIWTPYLISLENLTRRQHLPSHEFFLSTGQRGGGSGKHPDIHFHHVAVTDALTTTATYDIGSSSWFCGRKSGAKREFGQGFA